MYESFGNRLHRHIVWIYLPITRGDQLLALVVREEPRDGRYNLFVRTKHGGDVITGHGDTSSLRYQCLGKTGPLTFIYSEPGQSYSVPLVGTYCPPPFDDSPSKPLSEGIPVPTPIGYSVYYSWAPLAGISSTLVLYDENTGNCRSIVLCYENDGSRAVGQCRLHVDPAERVVRPLRLCFRAESYPNSTTRGPRIHAVRVKYKQSKHYLSGEEEDGWESRPLEGILRFWFANLSSILAVEN
jgi:hypothetical protein